MIRLIVSDLDGCLFDGEGRLPPDFAEVFDLMQSKGVLFAAASGRSVQGVSPHFSDICGEMAMITDNGACGYDRGRRLWSEALQKSEWYPVVEEARKIPGLMCVGCGMEHVWLEQTDGFSEQTANGLRRYYPLWEMVNYDHLEDPLIKLALFYEGDIEKEVYPFILQSLGDTLTAKVTATTWIDVFGKQVSKGNGVSILQHQLGIAQEETVVFGDYLNDLSMADYAERSFAPSNAHPEVRAYFTDTIGSHLEGSVTKTIRSLLTEGA